MCPSTMSVHMELAKRQRSIPCVRLFEIIYNYYKNHLKKVKVVIIMIFEHIKQKLTRLKFIRLFDLERFSALINNGFNYFNELHYLSNIFRNTTDNCVHNLSIGLCSLGNLVIRFWGCFIGTSMSTPRLARWPRSVATTTTTRPILVRSMPMSTTILRTTTTIMWVVWCLRKPVQDGNTLRRVTATKIESICNLLSYIRSYSNASNRLTA